MSVFVAPYVGAWIETPNSRHEHSTKRSHPMWVRGLKHDSHTFSALSNQSHPMWVRGLKLIHR